MSKPKAAKAQPKPNLLHLLKPYQALITGLLLFALLSNALTLIIPKFIQKGIDDYTKGVFHLNSIILYFSIVSVLIFVLLYLQSILQTYVSEKVARDLRKKLSAKISQQSFTYIQDATPGKLLTNLTSDVDAIKMFVSQAIVSIVSSIVLIIGAGILLVHSNWRLGSIVLLIIPIIGFAFMMVLKKVRVLFKKGQEVIDWLNKVINESIVGASLIRVLNAQSMEYYKFINANVEARNLGLSILNLFALLIPVIVFTANLGRLAVVTIGGHYVISGGMTMGEFAAFSSYISILIFPILIIGFMSNVIARASASYGRIYATLHAEDTVDNGSVSRNLEGNISLKNITVNYGEKAALKDISFDVQGGTRTAIIGPTAAGKSQLLYLLTTLIKPNSGEILYDNIDINNYKQESLLSQIGLAFQDSIIFNMSMRENIAFNATVTEEALQKAIDTAELTDMIKGLPQQMDTIISERGMSLSGGQKQRVMLARALAIEPKILLLDDFTARVDNNTEERILANLKKNYPGITLLSITQKIASAKDFEQIILLMEGELVAKGTHEQLMKTCPEYVQIFDSQQSIEAHHE
jgi:ATP-binding cassette subfamily B protein